MSEVHARKFPLIAVVMIAIGVAFIFNILPGYKDLFGPIVTLGFGVGMLIRYVLSDKEASKPPIVGIILTTVGAVLLISKLREEMDLGSLFMLVIGLMLIIRYAISKSARARFPMIGVVLAVIGALLLLGGSQTYYWVLPLLLVLGGILLIGRWHLSRASIEQIEEADWE